MTSIEVFKDLLKSAQLVTNQERRFLVDYYYQMQNYRITSANQMRSMPNEPHGIMQFLFNEMEGAEENVKKFLQKSLKGDPVGEWLLGVKGIGPVIASGFMAFMDLEKAPHASSFVRYAGLDPSCEWNKGEKRPFNAFVKTLCWKAGESFVKNQNRDGCFYGQLFAKRKEYEINRNERGENLEAAVEKLKKYNIGKTTEAYKHYKEGRLPAAHVHARARRWLMQLFLCHLWVVMWESKHGKKAENPWIIEHGGHDTIIQVPNWNYQA